MQLLGLGEGGGIGAGGSSSDGSGGGIFSSLFSSANTGYLRAVFRAWIRFRSWRWSKELFLTEQHQGDIIRGAGYDVSPSYASIPNYPVRTAQPLKIAKGGRIGSPIAAVPVAGNGQIVVQNNYTLLLQGDYFDDKATAWAVSEDGSCTVVKVVREGKTLRK